MINEVIFDLETKTFFDETGDFDPSRLGVSIVSVYQRKLDGNLKEREGKILSFWESDLPNIWPYFFDADRIVGFNSKRFDVAVLAPYAPRDIARLPHFDILEEIKRIHGRRVSLNKVAKGTLGRGKIDSGANAPAYWKSHDPVKLAKLKKYCEEDVLLTKELYDHGLTKGFLSFTNFWNTPFSIKVDFSYPPEFSPKSQKSQMGLF